MNFIFFITGIISILSIDISKKKTVPSCTCLSYELKDQLVNQEIVASVKIIRIDTIRVIDTFLGNSQQAFKFQYDHNSRTEKITFKVNKILKGKLDSDTFSVLSLSYCSFSFIKELPYIVAAHSRVVNQATLVADSIVLNTQSFLCTNDCCGNSIYYFGAEEMYMKYLK
jgi:hypothetical protein